jgi:hypothetical protein
MEGAELILRSDAFRRLKKDPHYMKGSFSLPSKRSHGETHRAVSSREEGITASPSERYECSLINGHLLAVIGDQRALLDTGFPISFGQCGSITLWGREFTISKEASPTTEELSKLIETAFSVVLGADVLSQLDFRINLPEMEITFSENFGDIGGIAVRSDQQRAADSTGPSANGDFPFLISAG